MVVEAMRLPLGGSCGRDGGERVTGERGDPVERDLGGDVANSACVLNSPRQWRWRQFGRRQ